MSNESQYFSPIVSAMMDVVRAGQNRQQFEQQKEQFRQAQELEKQRTAIAERAQTSHETQIENERQNQKSMIGHLHDVLQATMDMQQTQKVDLVQKLAQSGHPELAALVPGFSFNQGNTPEGYPTPPPIAGIPDSAQPVTGPTIGFQGHQIPASALYDPQQVAGQARLMAAAQSGGAAEGALPYEQQIANNKFQHDISLNNMKQQFESGELDKQLNSQKSIAKMSEGSQYAIQQMIQGTRLRMAGMGLNPDDDENYLQPTIIQLATGEIKPDATNPLHRAALKSMTDQGWAPLDPKAAEELKSLNALNPIFDRMTKFADKYLPDENTLGSIPAAMQAFWQAHLANTKFATDLKNEAQNIQTQAIPIGRGLEGMSGGRILSKQFEIDTQSLAAPGQTRQQAYSKINNLRTTTLDQEKNRILSGLPQSQQNVINQRLGIKSPVVGNQDPLGIR